MNKAVSPALLTLAALLAASPAMAQNAEQQAKMQPLSSAIYKAEPTVRIKAPEWAKNATLYELNTRQFTPEGTFKAAEQQLPRLKAQGIDIIWLMPIHPIGEKNRKGTLGSYYAVKDFYGVNPEFGTLADLKSFVDAAHKQGMHVILDIVANHTAWDNPLTKDMRNYEQDWAGRPHPTPWWDWSDIIDLNYDRPEVRQHVMEAMKYWVRDVGIDGFRADVAGYVPVDFWETTRAELDKIKPVFMLAEWDARDLHYGAFDSTYAWDWYNSMHNIAQGKADATALYGYYSAKESSFPREAMQMIFVENHDKNSWEGTQYEAFGDGLKAAITLSVIGEGIPLLHNGQEACNTKRLEFFEKDPIQWNKPCDLDDLYRKLFAYKKANQALWNGQWGAKMEKVENDKPQQIFSFIRRGDKNAVLAAFNFSKEPVTFTFKDKLPAGHYKDYEDGKAVHVEAGTQMTIPAWGYRVMAR